MVKRFVYFDLGNVLVTFDHRIAGENLARISGRSIQLVMNELFSKDLQTRYETGLVSDSDYVAEVNAYLDCDLPVDLVLDAISDMFQPNWLIIEALDMVVQASVPFGILSNTCNAHWQWLQQKSWPMLGYSFAATILSYEVQSMKPDAKIYAACEQACGLESTQIFFTDDRAENIDAAQSRGWTTHLYSQHDNDSLLRILDAWIAKP